MPSTKGRCLCGAIRYTFDPAGVIWRLHCHCESCRRATSSPITTYFAVRDTAWRWLRDVPAQYQSSAGVTRSFCARCGAPMTYATEARPDETHFYAATLLDPTDFAPDGHDFWDERLPWLEIADDLPKKTPD